MTISCKELVDQANKNKQVQPDFGTGAKVYRNTDGTITIFGEVIEMMIADPVGTILVNHSFTGTRRNGVLSVRVNDPISIEILSSKPVFYKLDENIKLLASISGKPNTYLVDKALEKTLLNAVGGLLLPNSELEQEAIRMSERYIATFERENPVSTRSTGIALG